MTARQALIPAWVAWLFPLVSGTLATSALVLQSRISAAPAHLLAFTAEPSGLATSLAYPGVGAWILSRQPGNRIGWILTLIGMGLAISDFATQYARLSVSLPETLPHTSTAWWLRSSLWMPTSALFAVLLLLFPDGRPPARRWIWLVWGLGGLIALSLLYALAQPQLGDQVWGAADEVQAPTLGELFGSGMILALLLGILLSALAMAWRFRRARSIERQQLKWFTAAGGIFAAGILGLQFAPAGEGGVVDRLVEGLTIVILSAPPLAVGMAILRYRLYEIDVIIRRTLVYSVLVALLALVFFGSVAILQRTLALLGGEQTQIVTVLSTLAIAGLFTPFRRRVQEMIDRRFYRSRYDAERVLDSFKSVVRDEVDLDALSEQLRDTVIETLQPERLSLWLSSNPSRVGKR